jgi:hypothetical protein
LIEEILSSSAGRFAITENLQPTLPRVTRFFKLVSPSDWLEVVWRDAANVPELGSSHVTVQVAMMLFGEEENQRSARQRILRCAPVYR